MPTLRDIVTKFNEKAQTSLSQNDYLQWLGKMPEGVGDCRKANNAIQAFFNSRSKTLWKKAVAASAVHTILLFLLDPDFIKDYGAAKVRYITQLVGKTKKSKNN